MELMDESLTSFLERPQDPPPLSFHIQVNIAHDVAQALAYLHLNEILHRDLSSNNVLLVGSSRAKVTDFGMSKLLGNNPHLTPTFCPGTMVYISPEALGQPPAYTRKLDIFSSGVLYVQLITCKFPDPGPRMQRIEIDDPRFPLGHIEAPILERERLRSHIDLIDPAHPLLRIALDCLKDKEGQRLTAEQLCSHLAALRESPRYRDSLQPAQQAAENLGVAAEAQAEPERELLQQNQELRQQLGEGREALQATEREVNDVTRNMEQLQLQSHSQERQVQDREAEIRRKNKQLQERNAQIQQKEAQIQQMGEQLHQISQGSEQLIATLQQNIEQKDEVIRTQAEALRAKEQALLEKERQLLQSQRVGGGKLRGPVPEPIKLRWKKEPNAPLKTFGETVAVLGRVAYFYSWDKKKIMMYNSETGSWAILPECRKTNVSIVAVNGLLTAIGGEQSNNSTRSLLSLTHQQKWTETFPPMTYYHNSPAVACTSTSLIVAGGWGPDEKRAPVEVMDTETLHWSTAVSLPYSRSQATATICGDRLYIAGGFVKANVTKSVLTKSVLSCVVSELLQSTATQYPSSEATPTASGLLPSTDSQRVWQELAKLPVYYSALVTLQGRLLAVGGCNSDATSAVHQYNSATNSWNVVSRMNKRDHCFAAVLPDNTLVVAGNGDRTTDSVEIASCV